MFVCFNLALESTYFLNMLILEKIDIRSFLFYGIIGKAVLQLKAICTNKRNTQKRTGSEYEDRI